jgi:hypothetical protein
MDDKYTADRQFRGGTAHRHEYQGQALEHSHPGGARAHGYFEHPEDGHPYPASGTPLADALAEVDKAAADGFAPDGTMRRHYRLALADLADVVRAHLAEPLETTLASELGPEDTETALATLAEVWESGVVLTDELSSRQVAVATRVAALRAEFDGVDDES